MTLPLEKLGGKYKILGAAALTYVAATLQAIATLLYLLMRAGSRD